MAKPLPEFGEFRFIENLATGAVHIDFVADGWQREEPREAYQLGDSGGRALAAMRETPTLVRCGQKTFPSRMRNPSHQYTNCFRDERLCAACYRTLTPADQPRAFEHATPDDADEDDEPEAAA